VALVVALLELAQEMSRSVSGETKRFGVVGVLVVSVLLGIGPAGARDDGRYADSPMKPWFESLRNKDGVQCCEVADGMALLDVDWDNQDGHYRIRIEGQWVEVPDESVVTQPNRIGRPIVWTQYLNGKPIVRCFMPGTMT
jgi:hypothetical protein